MNSLLKRLNFSNVMSTLAFFVALGGTSYAALQLPKNSVTAKSIRKNAVTEEKIRKSAVSNAKIKADAVDASKVLDGSLSGSDIDESSLSKVPSASSADSASSATNATNATNASKLDNLDSTDLIPTCPSGTVETGGVCFETSTRTDTTPIEASTTCTEAGGFLPNAAQLLGASAANKITIVEEWSSNWSTDGITSAFYTVGPSDLASDLTIGNSEPYRCGFYKS